MRDSYTGDISDYVKYALLRELAATGQRLGVAWYRNDTPLNGRAHLDGRRVEYLNEPAWRHLDGGLWNALARFRALPARSISKIQRLPIWPHGTVFHATPVPGSRGRLGWAREMANCLDACDIIFADPDNGVGCSSRRHATWDEITMLRRPGRALLLIKFPARVAFPIQVRKLHENLTELCSANSALTLMATARCGGRATRCWFTLIDADLQLDRSFRAFSSRLSAISVASAQLEPPAPLLAAEASA